MHSNPMQILTPSAKKTLRAYVWAYATSPFSDLAAIVCDFSPSRTGEHAGNFLQDWKACFERGPCTAQVLRVTRY